MKHEQESEGQSDNSSVENSSVEQTTQQELEQLALEALDQVMDVEINMSVIQGKMIHGLKVSPGLDSISLKFRPTSPVCPIALQLALQIKDALLDVDAFERVNLEVVDHNMKDQIHDILRRS